MTGKRDVLSLSTFGERVAEDEVNALESYFVETDQWHRIFRGDVDIVYGTKGSGKSAIYSLLLARREALLERQILPTAGENPRGTPAFNDLVADPPTTEQEFVGLWKLYLLTLVADQLREWTVAPDRSRDVIDPLIEAGLLSLKGAPSRSALVRSVLDYVRALLRIESVEGGLRFDPVTGLPEGLTGKITLREPSRDERAKGIVSVDSLFAIANSALNAEGTSIWVLLDRLDVAFLESQELEKNALRALFRAYLDLLVHDAISLKIFLRTDIWSRITKEGFREASHITRHATIDWDERSLLNLVVRRALQNASIRNLYEINDPAEILGDVERQKSFFYGMFPQRVDPGQKTRKTFEWMLSRTWDGSGKNAPRELIHLLKSVREKQLERLELGHDEPGNHLLFDGAALKEALPEVSRTRLEQTLYAEYPELADLIRQLDGEKTTQTTATLSRVWGVERAEALACALRLAEVGLFELRGPREERQFWVPFLYRDGLNMVQGSADE